MSSASERPPKGGTVRAVEAEAYQDFEGLLVVAFNGEGSGKVRVVETAAGQDFGSVSAHFEPSSGKGGFSANGALGVALVGSGSSVCAGLTIEDPASLFLVLGFIWVGLGILLWQTIRRRMATAADSGSGRDKKVRLHLELPPKAEERMERLQAFLETSNKTEVVRRALTVLDIVAEVVAKGGKVIIRDSQGRETELQLT